MRRMRKRWQALAESYLADADDTRLIAYAEELVDEVVAFADGLRGGPPAAATGDEQPAAADEVPSVAVLANEVRVLTARVDGLSTHVSSLRQWRRRMTS